jgi:hypothetical protein
VSRCYKFHAATPCISIAEGLHNTDHDQPMGYSDIKTLLVCAVIINQGFNYETAA